ncbi:uncharacterized protein OCT59_015770 [Rhizophagus irregularis]|uniref:uncharacterized protein n=1 Tax=Rhizophagus irregularis TaxID=588596 RepID=UPI003321ACC4|nr:hypothetical protein OCT59_015770 [Rhizophagus irregularis]
MSQKEKKGKQSARNPEDEVQNKSSRIIKRHPSRLLGISRDVATLSTTLSNHPARSKIPVTPDVERIRSNTRTTPGTQEGAGRDVVTPSNRSKIPVTSDVERIRPNTRSNTPGSVGRNTSSSSSLSSRSRIDNIKELQAKKPNIRLPSNLLNIFEKTDVAPPAEDLPTGNDEELKQQIYDLRIQNHQLECQNREFANQIETLKANITSLKDENEMLMSINEAFGQENEQLNDKIKRFRSFCIPRSLQSMQSSSQPRSSDEDLADGEDESSFHPVKRKRHKAKGKRIARNDDGEECDNEEARKKARRIKGAKSLFEKGDERLAKQPPPANVPDWAYVEQNTAYETDFDNQNTLSDGGAQNAPSNISDVSNQKRLSHEERRILIDSIHEEQMIQRKAVAESGDDYAPLTDEDYGSEMIE